LTDSSFYHAHELTVCKNLRNKYGIKSVIRGDECLGFGATAHTIQNALVPNNMSYPAYVPGMTDWFMSGNNIMERYYKFIVDLVDKYHCLSYDSLKDTLDFNERQHMNRNPLNYFKLPYVEVFCPLIDVDVLNVIQHFPSRFRQHKALFKRLVRKKIGGQIELAEYTNLTDWKGVFSTSDQYTTFFNHEFDNLPSFINPDFFRHLNLMLLNYKNKNFNSRIKNLARPLKKYLPIETVKKAFAYQRRYSQQYLKIPAHILVIRAAVLARWNDWWIDNN